MPLQPDFVKRKKKRRLAIVLFSIGFLGCGTLAILAFLGRTSGEFSIQLGEGKTTLTMSTTSTFESPSTYLKATGLANANTWDADSLPEDSSLDTDTWNGSHNGYYTTSSSSQIDTYLAYTFFIKNSSTDYVNYSINLSIDDYRNPVNESSSLLDILRVRIYENVVVSDAIAHDQSTYARKSNTPYTLENGTEESRECVGNCTVADDGTKDYSVAKRTENQAFADPFVDDATIFEREHDDLAIDGVVRYTVVLWLEGYDPDCTGAAPQNASITFSMHFNVLTADAA
jgi:hypothetical protein